MRTDLRPASRRAMNLREAAEQLACSEKTARLLISEGRLRAVRLGSGSRAAFRITPAAIAEFLSGVRHESTDK